MSINQSEDELLLSIKTNAILKQSLYVIAQAGGVVYTSFGIDSTKNNVTIKIPQRTFPTGIVQFTLFNVKHQPLAERLVFINHNDQLNIDVKAKNQKSKIKEKVTFDILAKDSKGIPIAGNFSVSVVDETKVNYQEDEEFSILANLLLSSELKGYVEQPNYYFNPANPERSKHLDYLMLTQGWRRFVWKDILANRYPMLNLLPEQNLAVTGQVTTTGGKAIQNAKMLLVSITPGYNLFLDTLSNEKGYFTFDSLNFPDTVSIIVQAKATKQGSDVLIKVDQLQNNLMVRNYPIFRANQLNYVSQKSDAQEKQERYNFSKISGISLKILEI
jgi:hypothetical protein